MRPARHATDVSVRQRRLRRRRHPPCAESAIRRLLPGDRLGLAHQRGRRSPRRHGETGMMFSPFFTLSGISARSFSLSFGISTVVMPPRSAASSFSFRPPIGSTRPRSVTSPVIATSRAHRDAGQHRDDRGRHGDARRRAVLRRRAFRHVDVDVALLEQRRLRCRSWSPATAHVGLRRRDRSPSSRRRACRWSASVPLPGTVTASIVRISPPTSVQARPVTTPTCPRPRPRRSGTSARPANFSRFLASIVTFFDFLRDDLAHRLARQVADLALEVPDAGFPRVVADQVAERLVGDTTTRRASARGPWSASAAGAAWRSRPSRPRCSRGCG